MIEPTLPVNIEAERATLGSLLMDRDCVLAVAPYLKPEAFYLERHRWIYEAVLACYEQRIPPELITVAEELRKAGRLADVGDIPALVELTNAVPTAYHVEYYAKIVVHLRLGRSVIEAGGRIANLGYDTGRAPNEMVETALEELQRATIRPTTREPWAAGAWEELERLADGIAPGVPTGLIDLDKQIGGFLPGWLYILAARPSVGKSSLALQLAYNIMQRGDWVYFVSLEMKKRLIRHRLLAMLTGIDLQRIGQHQVGDGELGRLTDATAQIAELPFEVDDSGKMSMADIRNAALQLTAERGTPGLIVVDYLQQVETGKRREENRAVDVGDISRGLKQLAMALDCPVLALSQLNRAVEGRQNHIPQLSDLRESGGIEQDGDLVMFIYRDEMYNKDTDRHGIADLIIAKNRQGPLGTVAVFFDKRAQHWRDLEPYRRHPNG